MEQSSIKCGIYFIRNKLNNKIYIGSSQNIYSRWSDHKQDLILNKHHSYKLQEDFNKYGILAFSLEIMEIVRHNNLKEIEQLYLDKYKPYENGYNVSVLAKGGRQSLLTDKQIIEIRYKMLNGVKNNVLIKNYNVSKHVIVKIRSYKTAQHICLEIKQALLLTCGAQRGQNCGASKLKDSQALKIKLYIEKGLKDKELSYKYKVSTQTINRIRHNKFWKHLQRLK